ncbi:MAG TPA: hypothetical protein VJS65_08195, partial [Verrucomicrobiae bacterium]|nr:hypothetical protein [Verrucomicrobiae bacterium]
MKIPARRIRMTQPSALHRAATATCVAFLFCLCSVFWAGCSSSPKKEKPKLTGDPLVDGENFIQNGPERDRVLWQYRTALTALRQGKLDLSKQYLD